MTHQKSEDRVVPEAQGNPGQTHRAVEGGGGKAVPVKEVVQHQLPLFATAASPRSRRGAGNPEGVDLSASTRRPVPKARNTQKKAGPVNMDPSGPQP